MPGDEREKDFAAGVKSPWMKDLPTRPSQPASPPSVLPLGGSEDDIPPTPRWKRIVGALELGLGVLTAPMVAIAATPSSSISQTIEAPPPGSVQLEAEAPTLLDPALADQYSQIVIVVIPGENTPEKQAEAKSIYLKVAEELLSVGGEVVKEALKAGATLGTAALLRIAGRALRKRGTDDHIQGVVWSASVAEAAANLLDHHDKPDAITTDRLVNECGGTAQQIEGLMPCLGFTRSAN